MEPQVQGAWAGCGGTGTSLPVHAPQRAPGVLHDPERRPVLLTVPHSQDSVVHLVRGVLAPRAARKREK